MTVAKYPNGDFRVRMDEYDNDILLERQGIELIWDLINNVELDFDLAGDQACASNYEMYYPLYNAYTGQMYLILDHDLEAYRRGQEVLLRGYVPSDEEMTAYYAQNE